MAALIRPARASDLTAVERLLQGAGLTTAGVAEHLAEFQIAEDAGQVVGTAGLEIHGRSALLRSVAVATTHRNRGIARDLVIRMLGHARTLSVSEILLLTTGAMEYFRRFGFEPVARDAVRAEVQVSPEFSDACCDSAQAMRLLIAERIAPAADRRAE